MRFSFVFVFALFRGRFSRCSCTAIIWFMSTNDDMQFYLNLPYIGKPLYVVLPKTSYHRYIELLTVLSRIVQMQSDGFSSKF